MLEQVQGNLMKIKAQAILHPPALLEPSVVAYAAPALSSQHSSSLCSLPLDPYRSSLTDCVCVRVHFSRDERTSSQTGTQLHRHSLSTDYYRDRESDNWATTRTTGTTTSWKTEARNSWCSSGCSHALLLVQPSLAFLPLRLCLSPCCQPASGSPAQTAAAATAASAGNGESSLGSDARVSQCCSRRRRERCSSDSSPRLTTLVSSTRAPPAPHAHLFQLLFTTVVV